MISRPAASAEVPLSSGSAGVTRPNGRGEESRTWLCSGVDRDLPTVDLTLWRSDAVVLFDWLTRVDFAAIPIEHPAEKQALADLLTRLEHETNVPSGTSGSGLTQDEIDAARLEVAADMGW